ncbi:hypothetical protein Tco_0026141 [Tanacetum coccineum]
MVISSPCLTSIRTGSPDAKRLIELASPEQTATGKDMSNPLYGCDGLPKTVRVFQFTLDSCSEKLDWFLLHQDWKLLFFDVATSFDSAVHRVHAVLVTKSASSRGVWIYPPGAQAEMRWKLEGLKFYELHKKETRPRYAKEGNKIKINVD